MFSQYIYEEFDNPQPPKDNRTLYEGNRVYRSDID